MPVPRAISDLTLLRATALICVPASFVWDLVFAMTGAGMCPSNRFLGVFCPACGLTRAFVAIANGEVAAAFAHNPASVLFWPGLALVLAHWAAERAGGLWRPLWLRRAVRLWLAGVAVAMVAGWLWQLLR